jgi:signal transduction histidine kinase
MSCPIRRRFRGGFVSAAPIERRDWLPPAALLAAAAVVVVSRLAARARESARLATEQAAVRRVATLVARGAPPEELFAGVVEEVARVLPVGYVAMGRYESDRTMSAMATWGAPGHGFSVGSRWPLGGRNLSTLVFETGQSVRMDSYTDASGALGDAARELGLRPSVGTPIIVQDRIWGLVNASSKTDQPLPPDTEARLASFTELVATAIANTDARMEATRLAQEHAALRRVATLVAREAPAGEVFATVAEEVGRLLGGEYSAVMRHERDGTVTVVASWGEPQAPIPAGRRMSVEGENVTGMVLRTGRPARIDDYRKTTGPLGTYINDLGIRSAVGAPIVVGERLWGVLIASSRQSEPLPPSTESRVCEFSDLVATAIANVQARSELARSRARIVAAADDERRRVVRDLHDGAQQRLVQTIITLKHARRAIGKGQEAGPALVGDALHQAERANVELRELAHGILPAVLARDGLVAGVEALASRAPVPVEIDVRVDRLPTAVEATAYFVVAEALTNVAKHAHAGHASVTARIEDGKLAVRVRDDGIGGARAGGSGLTGLADRLAALDGELRVENPADGGTVVAAAIPVP